MRKEISEGDQIVSNWAVLFSGLRARHLNPTVFDVIVRILFPSLGNPGGERGVMGLGMLVRLVMGEWWEWRKWRVHGGWHWRVTGEF